MTAFSLPILVLGLTFVGWIVLKILLAAAPALFFSTLSASGAVSASELMVVPMTDFIVILVACNIVIALWMALRSFRAWGQMLSTFSLL